MGGESNESLREKEFKRMGKGELIRQALYLDGRIAELEKELAASKEEKRIVEESRRIEISEAGSVAEASLRITAVFEEAQKAADIYLFNMREMEEQGKKKADECVREAQEEAQRIVDEAMSRAKDIVDKAKAEGERIRSEAEADAKKRESDADKYYESIKERTRSALMNLSRFNEDYEQLKMIANQQPEDLDPAIVISSDYSEEKKDVASDDGSTIDPTKLYRSVDTLIGTEKEAS